MHRKEYLIKFEPVGSQPYIFRIKEPIKEEILVSQVGKYIKIEDDKTRFVINKKHYKSFVDGSHVFKGHIPLSPLTGNIVQYAEVFCKNNCNQKKIKYVLKAGKPKKVEKEFEFYLRLNKTPGIHTLFPIGYIIDKTSNTITSGFHFTRLEEDVIPLSSIDHKSILKEERLRYIIACAETLANLHLNGYTHNDVNLKNFLLKKGKKLLIIDFVGMNYSKNPHILDLNLGLKHHKMQAIRYDLLTFLGQAIFNYMIREPDEIVTFIKSYINTQKELVEKRKLANNLEKFKPHYKQLILLDILESISLHKADDNIGNVGRLIRGEPIRRERENVDKPITENDNQNMLPFMYEMNSDSERSKDDYIKTNTNPETKADQSDKGDIKDISDMPLTKRVEN